MGPFDYDLGFDALERQGWNVRQSIVHSPPRDGGPSLDGHLATKRVNAARLEIYQGCEASYELRGQGRGRPKIWVVTSYEWFPLLSWTLRVGGKIVAEGVADDATAAAAALYQHLQSCCPAPIDGVASCLPHSAKPGRDPKDDGVA